MECENAGESGSFMLVTRRNSSLSAPGRHLVLGSLVLITFAVSVAFALHGAWLILPFAGGEMLLLYLAFRCTAQHAADFERISIDGDRVLIERWETGRVSRFEFNRYWAQVVMQREARDARDTLAVRSHGQQVEFGRHLTDEQRRKAARAIRQNLGVRHQ
jgi:uncharacterized membrane protein